MPAHVRQGTVVYRIWERGKSLEESGQVFHSLDELFAYCLGAGDPALVDRVILEGVGEDGRSRTLVFSFLSLSEPT